MRVLAAALLFSVVACSSEEADKPPVLEVSSPARGTVADAETVTVTGHVTDDHAGVKVTIAGTEVAVAADGSFSASVPVPPGIAIIETHAIDKGGNDVRDVRSVLAGKLAPSDGTQAGQVGARAGTTALTAVANAVATTAKAIDYTAAVQPMNPVYDNGGCLGATINITSVSLTDVDAALIPKTNLLATDVVLSNLVVKLSAKFKVACIGGSTTITVRASKTKIHGDLGARIASEKIMTSLANTNVTFDNFSVDVGGVPGEIESLLKGKARDGVSSALEKAIQAKVPPIADKALAGLLAKPLNTSILGSDAAISIAPTKVAISATDLFVGFDTKLKVTGGEGGTYLTTPTTVTGMNATQNLGIALDDDIINALFAGLWAADAFDKSISIDSIPALGALLDDDARTIDVKLALPPTVSTAGGELEMSVGDLLVTVKDENGAVVHDMAVSLRTMLQAQPTQAGHVTLSVGAPTVFAQVLANGDTVEEPLTDNQVEALITGVWGVIGVKADDALSKLPMPSLAGIQLGAPSIEAGDGFVLADVPVM
ncbi:MAG TPA: hypothetical protein VMZ53_08615 [Kofleriaceae bacterium]|nr:hypothetical protein [Kofleriaceae bacterium]